MKLVSFLFVFATLSLCLASSPIFVVLSDSECHNNKLISNLLDFGCDKVLFDACSADELFVAADFKFGKIIEVSRWADKHRAVYKFTVRHDHINIDGLCIESKFTIEYLLHSDGSVTVKERSKIVFSDYDFQYDEGAQVSGYKVIPSRQHHDSLLQQLLNDGNGYICQQARYRNQLLRLPASIAYLDVLAVNKISYRKCDDFIYYRYDVCLGDHGHKAYKVDATFLVIFCKKSGKYAVVAVEYTLTDLVKNSHCDQDYCGSDSDYANLCSDSSSDSDCTDKHHKSHKSHKSDCSDSDSDNCTDKICKSNKSDCSDSCDSDSDSCTDKNSHSHNYSHKSRRGPRFDHSDKNSNKNLIKNSNAKAVPKPISAVVAAPAPAPANKQ